MCNKEVSDALKEKIRDSGGGEVIKGLEEIERQAERLHAEIEKLGEMIRECRAGR